tara:strand:+ start:27 stop:299 length:273 start_codon:yes stop_codon:yes gene_type:complete
MGEVEKVTDWEVIRSSSHCTAADCNSSKMGSSTICKSIIGSSTIDKSIMGSSIMDKGMGIVIPSRKKGNTGLAVRREAEWGKISNKEYTI